MTGPTRFRGARLKVERARGHIGELREALGGWVSPPPFVLDGQLEPSTGHYVLRWRASPTNVPVPPAVALAAGDAAHNLRSALDHVAWELAAEGGGATDRTEFPIYHDRATYRRDAPPKTAGIAPRHAATIESLQPFWFDDAADEAERSALAANVWLGAVRVLDILDKHRVLLAASAVAIPKPPTFSNAWHVTGRFPDGMSLIRDGAEYTRLTAVTPIDPNLPITVTASPHFSVVVGSPEMSDLVGYDWRRPALSAADLDLAADAVLGVIDAFE